MKRVQLLEIEDQPWCPTALRDGCTAYITAMASLVGLVDRVLPQLELLLQHSAEPRIVDLCSGAGGPAHLMAKAFQERHQAIEVVCTDLFPNRKALAWTAEHSTGVRWLSTPVDATDVPKELKGARTLFSSFHHFPPDLARGILEDAVAANEPIGIFEFVGRHPAHLLGMFGAPAAVLALVPTLRPFQWSWLLLTYLVPAIPFMVFFDGLVSCLRVYDVDDLNELVTGLDAFHWEIGTFDMPGPGPGTYLVGFPRQAATNQVALG